MKLSIKSIYQDRFELIEQDIKKSIKLKNWPRYFELKSERQRLIKMLEGG